MEQRRPESRQRAGDRVSAGNAVLDQNGEGRVSLPEWFEASNRDFRYQLTCIGALAPIYVAEEIRHHRSKIVGGSSGLEVS